MLVVLDEVRNGAKQVFFRKVKLLTRTRTLFNVVMFNNCFTITENTNTLLSAQHSHITHWLLHNPNPENKTGFIGQPISHNHKKDCLVQGAVLPSADGNWDRHQQTHVTLSSGIGGFEKWMAFSSKNTADGTNYIV